MRFLLLFIFISTVYNCKSQLVYNPYAFYEEEGSLLDLDSIRKIFIDFYEPQYDSILDTNWVLNTGLRLPATISMSNGIVIDSVGVRYKGNSTYAIANNINNEKKPLNLDFNYFHPDQRLMDFKKIKLANALLDPTLIKEISAYWLYQNYLPSPEANYMEVYVQNNYLGAYVNTEAVDDRFLKKHFGENNGVLFKCDPIQQFGQGGPVGYSDLSYLGSDSSLYYNHYTLKSPHGWDQMIELTNILNNQPEKLDSILNIDRVLWAFAVNSVLLNLDTYNGLYQHNYYLYQTQDGRFQMIPWDASESYLGALLGSNPDPLALYEYDPFNGYNCYWYPLVSQLISNPNSKYGKLYAAHIRTIIEDLGDLSNLESFINQMQALALPSVSNDPNLVFGMVNYYTNVYNEMVIPGVFQTAGIISSLNTRIPFLTTHPSIDKNTPFIGGVNEVDMDGTIYITVPTSNADSMELMVTTSIYNSGFDSYPMFDDGTNGDEFAADGVFTALLPFQEISQQVKYYVRAQNTEGYKLSPEKAEYIFYLYNKADGQSSGFQGIQIYPNPASGSIQISTNVDDHLNCEIYDMVGNVVYSFSNQSPTLTIDVTQWASGIYIARVNGDSYRFLKN